MRGANYYTDRFVQYFRKDAFGALAESGADVHATHLKEDHTGDHDGDKKKNEAHRKSLFRENLLIKRIKNF